MPLENVSAAMIFANAIIAGEKIRAVYDAGITTPFATVDRVIHICPPTINNLITWRRQFNHEICHLFTETAWHWEAVKIIGSKYPRDPFTGDSIPLSLNNIVLDNIAERVKYDKYEGRKMDMSKGRLYLVTNKWHDIYIEPTDKTTELFGALFAWDADNRTTWMGYPMKLFKAPLDKYPEAIEYFEAGGLARMYDECKTPQDLLDINDFLLAYLDEKPQENGGQDESKKDDDGTDQSGTQGQSPVQGEAEEAEGSKTDDERSSQGDSGEAGPGEGDGGQDGSIQDGEDANPNQVNTPTESGQTNSWNVSSETKTAIELYTMRPMNNLAKPDEYRPIANITWEELKDKPNEDMVCNIKRLIGRSKISKKIQKYLIARDQQAMTYGHKSGKVASKNIYRTGHGGVNVYKRRQATRLRKNIAITMLLDCSASMNNGVAGEDFFQVRNSDKKIWVAQAALALLVETLMSLSIPVEVLGFTECNYNGVLMCRPIDFNERLKAPKIIDRLASIPTMGNNADAESVLEAVNSLSKRKEQRRMLMVLSDGNPVGKFTPSREAHRSYLKQVCEHIHNDTNIELLGIGIGTDAPQQYYPNNQVLRDPSNLDEVIMNLLRNNIV